MRFGLFVEFQNPALRPSAERYAEGMATVELADELGYDFVWFAEHHFSTYGMSPAPLLPAVAAANRTRRLKVGTGILVLPIWNPLRAAEEVAVADQLSGGRLFVGIGRGYQNWEYSGFGIPLDDSNRGRFQETIDAMVKAWTSDVFTFEGQYVRIQREYTVWPKPLQRPHPPIWVAGVSPDTIQFAGRRGYVLCTTGFLNLHGVRQAHALYLQARQEAGLSTSDYEFGIQPMVHVAESDAEALAALPHARWQNRAGQALRRGDPVVRGQPNAIPYEGERDDEAFLDTVIFGSPETVIRKLKAYQEIGVTLCSCWMDFGAIEHERMLKSLRLLAEQVMPALATEERPTVAAEGPVDTSALPGSGGAPSG